MLEIVCRGCGHQEVLSNDLRGRVVRCRHCDRQQRAFGKQREAGTSAGTNLELKDEALPDRQRWQARSHREPKPGLPDWRARLNTEESPLKQEASMLGYFVAFTLLMYAEIYGLDMDYFSHWLFYLLALPGIVIMVCRWIYAYFLREPGT